MNRRGHRRLPDRKNALVFSKVCLAVFSLALALPAPATRQFTSSERITREAFLHQLSVAAIERTSHSVRYVSSYARIPYPGGDVPADTGVCTDEIVRIYRAVGVDLQKEVHEDMVANFALYPHHWQADIARPDSNIDHRRVPNLMVFFSRKGESLPTTSRAEDYSTGDLVTWDLGRGVPHIGIVIDKIAAGTGRHMIVHNIGAGPKHGGRAVQLADHRPLPILRTGILASRWNDPPATSP
jgi:uncharacterized protein YijF (DUF1287 family)